MAETEARQDDEAPDAVALAHKFYRASRDHTSEWRQDAREAYDMEAGAQWRQEDLMRLNEQQRQAVVFNRVLRTINAVAGTQVANRQETRFIPREQGDVKVNEIISAASEWVRDGTDAEDEESDAFRDMCICGMGWTETRMDYTAEPDGKGRIERIDPLEMYWDPAATKRNLADARWVIRIRLLSLDEFREQWPDADADIAGAPWEDVDDDTSKRTHVYPQDAYKEEQARKGKGGKGTAMIRVGQVQWSVPESSYRVGKKATSLPARIFEKLRGKLEAEKVPFLRQEAMVWKQAFIAGGVVLDEGPCPYPDGPTFRPMTYMRDRNKNTWFGLVKAMIDPQRFGNKFFSLILDILAKGSKGGVMIEADATDDIRALEEKWARPDAVHVFRPGALSGKKIQPKPTVDLPQGLDRLMGFSMDAVHEVTGINLELLGFAGRNQPGVLERERKSAGLTILAPLFDAMRRYRKEQGRVLLYFIQTYLSDGRLIRIMGQNGNEQYVPLVKEKGTALYDVIVDESPTSPNMKEKVFGALVEILPMLGKMGVPLPPELLDYAPIPSVLAQKWKEMIEQAQGGELPPEVQKQMQKLAEENAKLKDKKEETATALQLKGEEQQTELQLKAQDQQAEQQLAEQESQAKLDIQREEMNGKLAIQRIEAMARIATQAAEGGEGGGANEDLVHQLTALMNASSSPPPPAPPASRRITVRRGQDGMIAGADVEDVLDSLEPMGNA